MHTLGVLADEGLSSVHSEFLPMLRRMKGCINAKSAELRWRR